MKEIAVNKIRDLFDDLKRDKKTSKPFAPGPTWLSAL